MCPDAKVWQAFLDGSIAEEQRSAAESHLARCRLCRERVIALSDAGRENATPEEAPTSLTDRARKIGSPPSRFGPFRPYIPLALAAGIVLAVGLSVVVYRRQTERQTSSELRQSDLATVALSLSTPADGAVMEPGQMEFRWGNAGPGARYEFTITDEKGDIVFHEKPANTLLSLDSRTLKLSPQRKYYWTVSAKLPDGTKRESRVAGFTVK